MIKLNRVEMNVGTFADELEAALAYDAFAIANGVDMPLNFPGASRTPDDVASRFRGVLWHKTQKKWYAQVAIDGSATTTCVGRFRSEIEAAHAYDAFVVTNGVTGEAASLNFREGDGNERLVQVARAYAEAERDRVAAAASAAPGAKISNLQGVHWKTRDQKWHVEIKVGQKRKRLGSYADERVAAHMYDAYVLTNSIDASLNFPSEDPDAVVADAEAERARVEAERAEPTAERVQAWQNDAKAERARVEAFHSQRFRGVRPSGKRQGRTTWRSEIRVGGKPIHIGTFSDEIAAAHAYDAYAIANGIETPSFNFPDKYSADIVTGAERVGRVRARNAQMPRAPAACVVSNVGHSLLELSSFHFITEMNAPLIRKC